MINNQPTYTEADILRYLDGGMTSKEMRQLELAALDDPFLEDAIDGYRLAREEKTNLQPYIKAVKNYPGGNVQNSPAKVVGINWRKTISYAAAAVVVFGLGFYIYKISSPNNFNKLPAETAQTLVKIDSSNLAAADKSNLVVDSVPVLAQLEKEITTPLPPKADAKNMVDKEAKKEEQAVAITSALAEEDALKDNREQEFALLSKPAMAPGKNVVDAKSLYAKESNAAKKAEEAKQQFEVQFDTVVIPLANRTAKAFYNNLQHEEDTKMATIKGKVIDGEKYPLDNITLRIKGTNHATLSDELGRFEMIMPDSNATLIASGPGFATKEFKVSNQELKKLSTSAPKLELQLEHEASLEEMVVSDFAKKRKAKADAEPVLEMDTTDAAPVGGWQAYSAYIEKNKKFKNTPGRLKAFVILVLEVGEDGKPINIEVVKSAGKEFNEEAIRLIKAGPLWKNKTDEETGMAKITVVL